MRKIAAAALATAMVLPFPAGAWGLKTHLWIAASTLQDIVKGNCSVPLAGQSVKLPQRTCDAILARPGAFYAGAIGPDAFPDMVTGQMVVHPGEGKWQSADWIAHLLEKAETDAEIAFAWGYAIHAAGDVFAHSYVNRYAGDLFILSDGERLAEERHFRLEKYIDQRLPPVPGGEVDVATLEIPEKFLADQLIFAPSIPMGKSPLVTFRMLRDQVLARQVELDAAKTERESRFEDAKRALADAERETGILDATGFEPTFSKRLTALKPEQRKRIKAARAAYDQADRAFRLASDVANYNKAWAGSIEIAAQRFLEASLDVARLMVAKSGEPGDLRAPRESLLEPYSRWFACHREVMIGQPWQVADARCDALGSAGGRGAIRMSLLTGVSSDVRDAFVAYERFSGSIRKFVLRAFLGAFRILDPASGMLARDMLLPEPIDADMLNKTFRGGPIAKQRGFARFDCISALIEQDMGIRRPANAYQPVGCPPSILSDDAASGTLDPQHFAAFRHALTLARLALVDRERLTELVSALGGDARRLRMRKTPERYSVLLDSVRSLDGNQQWKAQAMPFPRMSEQTAAKEWAMREKGRHFGYASGEEPGLGFPLYVDAGLRATVFNKLFPVPFEADELHPEAFARAVRAYSSCPNDALRPTIPTGSVAICKE